MSKRELPTIQELSEQLSVKTSEIQAILASGVNGIQSRIQEIEFKLPTAKGERKVQLMQRLSVFLLLLVFLTSCANVEATSTDTPHGDTGPTVTEVAPPIETEDVGADIEPTDAEFEPVPTEVVDFDELTIDYGRYSGDEAEIDPYVERAWDLINEYIVGRGIAAPTAIKLIDVSADNVIVEVLPQGRTDDYPEGTNFTISFVAGHEGELLTVSLDGANTVAGGAAVELAIGVNNLPVALNAEGQVVAYVDGATGQWVAGSQDLAPEVVEVPYFEMSPADRLAESQVLAEQANGYSGEVSGFILPDSGFEDIPFYWHPELEEWKTLDTLSSGGYPEADLDIEGDTFPQLAIPGYENADGTLVMVDPDTGVETVFEKVFVPGLGEISMREIFQMGQEEFNNRVREALLSGLSVGEGDEVYDRLNATSWSSFYYPGFAIDQHNLYATKGAGGGPLSDIPERGTMVFEHPTNSFAIPIFSPETGEFMFFLNVQQGNLPSVANFTYGDGGGSVDYDWARGIEWGQHFGSNGSDEFAVMIEFRETRLSHKEAGGGEFLLGEEEIGIGNIADIEAILSARTEQEIIDILNDYGVIFSVPTRIAHPGN